MEPGTIVPHLERLIRERRRSQPEGSYTAYLFAQGQDKILKKIGEEAAETIIASKNDARDELVAEASDLLYHLLVLLAHHDLSFAELEQELARRHREE